MGGFVEVIINISTQSRLYWGLTGYSNGPQVLELA